MTDKEFAEIKKRFRPDRSNITTVRGCYVSATKEITTRFKIPVGALLDEQQEWLMKLLKKPISGAVGRNLINIDFSVDQVNDGEEHKLLSEIRVSELENEELLDKLYEKIINSYTTDMNYLILLAYDRYDVPSFSKNDELMDDSSELFRYYICCVCPIKITKSALGFSAAENGFCNIGMESAVTAPEVGFMFPCFDDRRTNLYNAVFYSKSISDSHPELVESLFGAAPQMPAQEQKENFRTLVSAAAPESCNYDFVQSVQGMIKDIITEHKDSKDPEPLMFDKNDVRRVLASCGAQEEELGDFDEKFESEFGETTEIPPQNIIDPRQLELKNSYMSIKVDPQYSFMVNTKVIDGVRYVMVRADEGVEVNGISIRFDGEPLRVQMDENTADETTE